MKIEYSINTAGKELFTYITDKGNKMTFMWRKKIDEALSMRPVSQNLTLCSLSLNQNNFQLARYNDLLGEYEEERYENNNTRERISLEQAIDKFTERAARNYHKVWGFIDDFTY